MWEELHFSFILREECLFSSGLAIDITVSFFCALFCDFITLLPFSYQVTLPSELNPWAFALAAFFLEKYSQSSTCCHLCKLWPSFSYQCMCSCCMSLVAVRLFATNLESKFEPSQVFTLHITPYVSYLLFSQCFFFF